MRYKNILPLLGALLAAQVWLQGPALLAAWMLVGASSAFWWKGPRFGRAVLGCELLIALGYCLLASSSPQLHWLTRNSALPAWAWLAIPVVFNVLSAAICVGVPHALATRLRRLRPRPEAPELTYAAPRPRRRQAV